ncbi:tRNA (guanosine(18)-2'-O)-methyltransferase TrmH [Zhongshania aliphaticivorans]|uniref:tRNA (guanosine(18)-2'-O)-methyltransferase TrmH n=1 Tax=Zhongshania aliphaticivorans TaxID=1470434 RepID=UPI0012E6EC7D|nr:tRNA (guanosine(18)-2'-O)-methyltransferase TrmH [Zhongshania aliphaticivorans]CAA0081088.1 tRNA (guanosine(18)-2'-O)-methyltransferase [Zhongshania aliphaticivorans]
MTAARFQRLRQVLEYRQPDLTIVTDNVHKVRNLSAIVRTADAAGIGTMYCAMPDKDYKAFKGTAMGSHSWVSVQRQPDVSAALRPLKATGYQILATHLADDSVDFREADYTRPTVILLGAEKLGVSAAGCELADMHITIPMRGMVQSFNVSVAAGIILAEVERQRQLAGLYSERRLDDQAYHRTLFEWAQPRLSEYCRENGLAYPALNEDGELVDGLAWQHAVREGSATTFDW